MSLSDLNGLNSAANAALLDAVVKTSPDAIVTIDARGAIQSFNPAAEALFGYSEQEVMGVNVKVLMPQHFAAHHDDDLVRYQSTSERHIIGTGRIVDALRKDGSIFPVELFVGEAAANGRRIFIGFMRDLSELERRHRRIQELQVKLFHVSRLGEMGQIASGLAHEVTQPLAAIMNYSQAARRMLAMPDPPREFSSAELFEKIEQQARRAADIIKHLRTFVEKRDIQRGKHDLHEIIAEALTLALVGPARHSVRIQMVPAAHAVIVDVDRVQIQQVLINLVRNGIDAMEESADREISIVTAADGPDFARISVSDKGCGVAPQIKSQLFESFVTTKQKGLGVGLSISQTIVQAHGGKLWFTPNAGAGTTFHFTVPLAKPEPETSGSP